LPNAFKNTLTSSYIASRTSSFKRYLKYINRVRSIIRFVTYQNNFATDRSFIWYMYRPIALDHKVNNRTPTRNSWSYSR
jgi:hypothetical protein